MSAESVLITYNVEIFTYIYMIYNIYIYIYVYLPYKYVYYHLYIYMQCWMLIRVTGLIKGH